MARFVTVGELAAFLHVESWKVRMVVDELGVATERCGRIRMIPSEHVDAVKQRLTDRKWYPPQVPAAFATGQPMPA